VEVILWLEVEEAPVELVDRVVAKSVLLVVGNPPDPVIVEDFDAELELAVLEISVLFALPVAEDEEDLVDALFELEDVLEVLDEMED
jgi:hypothetical protein